jgi:hypothetical protein
MWENIKKDPLLKTIVVTLIGILTFGLAFRIMFGAGNSGMGEGEMSMSSDYSLGNTLEIIIALLIKLTIIALITGILVWLFRSITRPSGCYQNKLSASSKVEMNSVSVCPSCNTRLKENWKCCPVCGKDKTVNTKDNGDEVLC